MSTASDISTIALRYRLGELTLGSCPLHLMTVQTHLDEGVVAGNRPAPLPPATPDPGPVGDGWYLPCYR